MNLSPGKVNVKSLKLRGRRAEVPVIATMDEGLRGEFAFCRPRHLAIIAAIKRLRESPSLP